MFRRLVTAVVLGLVAAGGAAAARAHDEAPRPGVGLLLPQGAWAPTATIDAFGLLQASRYRDAAGNPYDRARYTQFAGFTVCGQGGCDRWRVSLWSRIDLWFGPDRTALRALDRFGERARFALQAFAFEARRLGELVDLAVGRRSQVDETGFVMYDGAHVDVRRNGPLALSLWAGAEVRDALSVRAGSAWIGNANPWQWDGTSGDARPMGLYGAALRLDQVPGVNARVGFYEGRRGERVQRRLVYGSAGWSYGPWLRLDALYAHDLLFVTPDRLLARVEVCGGCVAGAEAGYEYRRPRFDPASVFAVFYAAPARDLFARVHWRPSRDTDVTAGYTYRLLEAGGLVPQEFWSFFANHEATLSVQHRFGSGRRTGGRAFFSRGGAGTWLQGVAELHLENIRASGVGFDVVVNGGWYADRLWVDTVAGASRPGATAGAFVAAGYDWDRHVRTRIAAEANTNPRHRFQYATYVFLDVSAWL